MPMALAVAPPHVSRGRTMTGMYVAGDRRMVANVNLDRFPTEHAVWPNHLAGRGRRSDPSETG